MADPLDSLRDIGKGTGAPDPDVIRARARRIQNRRYAALGTSAGVVLLVVALGVVLPRSFEQRGNLVAERASQPAGPPAPTAAAVTESAADTAAGVASLPLTGADQQTAAVPAPQDQTSREARAAMAASRAAPSSDRRGPAAVEALSVRVESSKPTFGPAEKVTLNVTACNTATHEVDVTYPSAQRFDIEVRRGQTLVWRWSKDWSFAQAVQDERWAPGECKNLAADWDGAGTSPGRYEAVGVVTSSPTKRSAPIDVCYVSCA